MLRGNGGAMHEDALCALVRQGFPQTRQKSVQIGLERLCDDNLIEPAECPKRAPIETPGIPSAPPTTPPGFCYRATPQNG